MTFKQPDIASHLPASVEEGIGKIVCICASLDAYMFKNIWDIRYYFLPPVKAKQYRIFQVGGEDVGFFTWAQLSEDASDYLEKYFYEPRPYEWTSGDRLWVIDMVCHTKHAHAAAAWIRTDPFTLSFMRERRLNQRVPVKALRRDAEGKVQKIARFRQVKKD